MTQAESSAHVVRAKDLARFYGDVVGVCDLSVDIPRGTVGLLGPNGAGKSTFLKLLAGELQPSRGSIEVLGAPPFANPAVHARLGFCPQQDALWDDMTAVEFVEFLLRLSGRESLAARSAALAALERVQLVDAKDRRLGGFSKGMRQRVRIAQAIAHEPELVVLDEPLTGLDPLARHATLELFRQLAAEGASVLFSTHVLHEVEDRTITYLLLRPVPRASLLFGRLVPAVLWLWASCAAGTALLVAAAATARGSDAGVSDGTRLPLLLAACAGVATYTALHAALGVWVKHAMIVGLAYSFTIEGFLSNLPGRNQSLTIQHHLRSLVAGTGDDAWQRIDGFGSTEWNPLFDATLVLALVVLVACIAGAWRLARRQFDLPA